MFPSQVTLDKTLSFSRPPSTTCRMVIMKPIPRVVVRIEKNRHHL